jgi:hypothetical protein
MATAVQVAQEVKKQGGSDQQAWVAAALVSGIESNGQPTDQNPTSSACGLFQFLTTTWIANGGGKYAPNACAATWQQQVSVYLTASQGNNFYPWAPDLGGSYNGKPIYAPASGSAVGNKISQLSATGSFSFLGNVPQSFLGGTGAAGAATPTQGLTSLIPGGGSSGTASSGTQCTPVIGEGGILGVGSATLLNSCQASEIVGALLMGVGAIALVVGFAIVLADVGLRKSAPAIVGAVIGDKVGKRSAARKAAAEPEEDDATEPEEDDATKNARAEYNRQQRSDYRSQVGGRSGSGRKSSAGTINPHRVESSATPDF